MNAISPDEEALDDPRVAAAVVAFLAAQDSGQPLNPETWLNSHPTEIQPALRDFLEVMGVLVPTPVRKRSKRVVPAGIPDFDTYIDLRKVGAGGMGAVYRAIDTTLGRVVAVKVLHTDLAVDPAKAARFLAEAQVASQLQHPNITPVYAYGVMPGSPPRPYFTMRLVEGESLVESTAAYHANPTDTGRDLLLRQFIDVCNAVAYAHARKVLHRDLKPGNVMVGGFGEVQVMDWGLAKDLQTSGFRDRADPSSPRSDDRVANSDSATETGAVMGTPSFMAPEQANGEPVDTPTDVFALGGLLAYLLTGQAVYTGKTPLDIFQAAQRCDTGSARDLLAASGAAAELVAIAGRCLERSPPARFPSARAVGLAVADYLGSVERRAREAEVSRGRAEERAVHERRRRRWQLAAGGVVLALIATAVAGWRWSEWRREQRAVAAARDIAGAVGKAEQLRDQARAMPTGTTAELQTTLGVWRQGKAAVEQAEGFAAIPEAPVEGRADAARMRAEYDPAIADLEARLDLTRRQDVLLASLRAARRQSGARLLESRTDYEGTIRAYRQAFLEYGIDPATNLKAAAASIRGCADPFRTEVLDALHVYGLLLTNNKHADAGSIRAVLDAADDDASRKVLRTAMFDRRPELLDEILEPSRAIALPVALLDLAAQLLSATGRHREAGQLLADAARRHPADYGVQLTYGNYFVELQTPQFRDAAERYRVAVALNPDSSPAWSNLGLALVKVGELDEAEASIREALRIEPDNAYALMNLGLVAMFKSVDFQAMLKYAARAKEIIPWSRQARGLIAFALLGTGDQVRAEKEAREVLETDPGNLFAAFVVFGIHAIRGQAAEALAVVRQYRATAPDGDMSQFFLLLGLLVDYEPAAAEAAARELIRRLPHSIFRCTCQLALSMSLRIRGQLAEAEVVCDSGLANFPGYAPFLDEKFQVLFRKGKFREARAVAVEMNRTSANVGWGYLYRQRLGGIELFISWEQALTDAQTRAVEPGLIASAMAPEMAVVTGRGGEIVKLFHRDYATISEGQKRTMGLRSSDYHTFRFTMIRGALLYQGPEGRKPLHWMEKDGPRVYQLTEDQQLAIRRGAARWFRDETYYWLKRSADPDWRAATKQLMWYCKSCPELAPVREPAALAALPPDERAIWQESWKRVDGILATHRSTLLEPHPPEPVSPPRAAK